MDDFRKLHQYYFKNSDFAQMLPFPDVDANKYSRGKLEVIAGNAAYPGAAILCSMAANVSGCGYVRLFCDPSHVSGIAINYPDVVVRPYSALIKSVFESNNKKREVAYVIGPGFDSSLDKNKQLIYKVLKYSNNPVVIDGGALSFLTSKKARNLLRKRYVCNASTILTPHAGEANRLLSGCNIDKSNRHASAKLLAQVLSRQYFSTIVLKGSNTHIVSDSSYYLMSEGTEALSKAGTGDVLAGIMGSILATGKLDVFKACSLASYIHAKSARFVVDETTSISLLPSELVSNIAYAIKDVAICDKG